MRTARHRARPGSRSPGRGSACRRRSSRCWSAAAMPSAPIHSRARPPSSSRMPATSSAGASRVSRISVARTRCGSRRRGRRARTAGPGEGGTITGNEPISSATALACSGPAPPKATSANSRGSWPRCTQITRSAPAMFSLTIRRMPSAASSSERPIASAIFCTAARAASTSSVISPPIRSRREVAEDDVGVGHRRLRRRPGRRPPGRARRRRTAGPTRSAPVSCGTCAIEPPPAPTVCTSTLGTLIRNWPIVVSRPIVGSPSWHSDDVGRRAAHVEREHVREARPRGDVERARDAAGRARRARRRPGCARPPSGVITPASERRMSTSQVDAELLQRALQPVTYVRHLRAARRSSCRPSACARTRGTRAARRAESSTGKPG